MSNRLLSKDRQTYLSGIPGALGFIDQVVICDELSNWRISVG